MMDWFRSIFANYKPAKLVRSEFLTWTSCRGDAWYCADATANFSNDTFTIECFGQFAEPTAALALLQGVRRLFPNATIEIHLNSGTEPTLKALSDQGYVEAMAIELSPSKRVARITGVTLKGAASEKTMC